LRKKKKEKRKKEKGLGVLTATSGQEKKVMVCGRFMTPTG
jgi:hypothetical protein